MSEDAERWEVVRGIAQDDTFVELWDRSLAPNGMALAMVAYVEGQINVTGYDVPVPFEVFVRFLSEGRTYLAEYIAAYEPVEKAGVSRESYFDRTEEENYACFLNAVAGLEDDAGIEGYSKKGREHLRAALAAFQSEFAERHKPVEKPE